MKTVWVIGAGASKSHTKGLFPTADGLLTHALDRYLAQQLPGRETGLLALREYTMRRLGEDLHDRRTLPDIETILGFIDSDLEATSEPSLLLARGFLMQLVRADLLALHRAQAAEQGEYNVLAARLKPTDSVITFNWDILLDDALGRRQLVSPGKQPQYGAAAAQYESFFRGFSGVGAGTIESLSPPAPIADTDQAAGIFLKLHGSIDWLACANPHCRNSQLVFPTASDSAYCGACLEELQCVLVPPVVTKRVREWALLRRLWNRAAAEVSATHELVLWGYSLPAIDFQSRWLLSHAQTGRLERLTIVNPIIGGKADIMTTGHYSFVDAVRRAFGTALARCTITLYENFEDLMREQPLAAKYPDSPHWQGSIVALLRNGAV